MSKRKVICAAIRDNNLNIYEGKRHNDCIWLMTRYGVSPKGCEQGFLVTGGYFVDRITAKQIAIESGQIKESKYKELYSEDLY